jgi:carbonic anhydrase
MTALETLLARHAEFLDSEFEPLPPPPSLSAVLLTCVDARVDPAHTLGLELGEAAVLRNVGGRVTPALVETLGLLAAVLEAGGPIDSLELILLQHTECGMAKLADRGDLLCSYLGVAAEELASKAPADPRAAVEADFEALRADPPLSGGRLTVSGLVFDVATGAVETVVPPTRV